MLYIASKFDQETPKEEIFVLDDGTKISLGVERYTCPEVFFKPSLLGRDTPSFMEGPPCVLGFRNESS